MDRRLSSEGAVGREILLNERRCCLCCCEDVKVGAACGPGPGSSVVGKDIPPDSGMDKNLIHSIDVIT